MSRACGPGPAAHPAVDRPSHVPRPALGARSTAEHTTCELPRDAKGLAVPARIRRDLVRTHVPRRRSDCRARTGRRLARGRRRHKPWNRRPLRRVRGTESRPGPGGGGMRPRIVSTVVAVLVMAVAVFLVAGYGGGIAGARGAAAGLRSPGPSAVSYGSAITSGSSAALCRSAPRRGRHPVKQARAAPPGQVRVTRIAIVTLGGSAGVVAARGACAVRPLRLGAGIHLCPPGFWRLYRLSVSGGRRHTPALFPFPVGCGAAGRAGTMPEVPPAAPLPLVTAPG
jgi:hypothetical protein